MRCKKRSAYAPDGQPDLVKPFKIRLFSLDGDHHARKRVRRGDEPVFASEVQKRGEHMNRNGIFPNHLEDGVNGGRSGKALDQLVHAHAAVARILFQNAVAAEIILLGALNGFQRKFQADEGKRRKGRPQRQQLFPRVAGKQLVVVAISRSQVDMTSFRSFRRLSMRRL